MHAKGYGMPSSYAQFLFFFSTSLTLFLLFRRSPSSTVSFIPNARVILPFALYLGAFTIAGSRVYLNYHTPKQVLVGCLAGTVCAVAWFVVMTLMRQAGFVNLILNTRIARVMCVRDLVTEMEVWEMGWIVWEEKRRKVLVINGKKSR